jgi:SOS-response transcriptional repressor LexA
MMITHPGWGFVVVESRDCPSGDMVVALIDGENVAQKYYPEGSRYGSAAMKPEPIFVDSSRVKIQGVIVSVMRKYQ